MNVHDFVKHLLLKKVYTAKQSIVIDNIIIYINDSIVYKYIISINPLQIKKAKRLGLNSIYNIFDKDIEPIKLKIPFSEAQTGRYMFIINPNTFCCDLYKGEETAQEQIERIKNWKKNKNNMF